MSYLYETHLHTSQSSICGVSRGREYISRYKDLGYTGIIVTDHFYNGNCNVDRGLPWRKWVDQFCRGYEDAREEGIRRNLDVFFGWEETFDADDYLVYGLDKQWLLEHPEVIHWTRLQQFEEARYYGGCVVQAHPFRQYGYIRCIHLSTGCVDAVEIANGPNERSFDALAAAYARKIKVPATAGSDIHRALDAGPYTAFGVVLDRKIENISDYVRAIRSNTIKSLHMPKGRCDLQGDEQVRLPVDIRDSMDRSTGEKLEKFLEL